MEQQLNAYEANIKEMDKLKKNISESDMKIAKSEENLQKQLNDMKEESMK